MDDIRESLNDIYFISKKEIEGIASPYVITSINPLTIYNRHSNLDIPYMIMEGQVFRCHYSAEYDFFIVYHHQNPRHPSDWSYTTVFSVDELLDHFLSETFLLKIEDKKQYEFVRWICNNMPFFHKDRNTLHTIKDSRIYSYNQREMLNEYRNKYASHRVAIDYTVWDLDFNAMYP